MKRRLLLPAVVLIHALTGIGRSQNDPDSEETPASRTPSELMKAVGMKPIAIPPGTTFRADSAQAYAAWLQRVLLEPFRKKTAGHSQGAAAATHAGESFTFLSARASTKDRARAAELLAQAQKLVAAGMDDPFFLWQTARLAGWGEPNEAVRRTLLEKAHGKLDGAGYSALLTQRVCRDLATTRYQTRERDPIVEQMGAACLAMQSEPGLITEETVRYYIEMVVDDFTDAFLVTHASLGEKLHLVPSLPEWARETLAGAWEVQLAWKDRGNGWADTVTAKGWEGFSEHLGKARTHLVRAWELKPTAPWAAAKMMSVVGGGCGEKGDTLRLWFDRSTAAMFDYTSPYSRYIGFSRPRWGGSHEEIAAFGLACAATKRFDTIVPSMLLEALDTIAEDSELPETRRQFFRDRVIAPAVVFVCDSYVAQAQSRAERELWLARTAAYSWLAGNYVRSAAAMKQLPAKFPQEVVTFLRRLHMDETQLRAETAIALAGQMKAFEAAVDLYEKRSNGPARQAFIAVGRAAGAESQPAMRRWLALLDIEEKFQRGETVTLTADTGLSLWETAIGKWQAGPDGSLVATGWDGYGRIFHRARFSSRMEMQADVEFSNPKPLSQGISLTICGRKFASHDVAWNGCSLSSNTGQGLSASLLYQFYKALPDTKQTPFRDFSKVHLTASCADKKMTFKINDWTAFDNVSVTRKNEKRTPFLYPENGWVGFAHHRFLSNHTITIRNITVRRIP